MQKKRTRLVMIAYAFPPMHAIAAVRTYSLSKILAERFDEIIVISTSNIHLMPQNVRDLSHVTRVIRIPTLDYKTFKHLRKKKSNDKPRPPKQEASAGPSNGKPSVAQTQSGFSERAINSFPINVSIAYGGLLYVFLAWLVSLRYCLFSKAVLFSSFRPFADHFTAFMVKLFCWTTPWIADYRDLQMYPGENNVLLPRLQQWIARVVLGRSTRLSAVSRGIAAQLESYHEDIVVARNAMPLELERGTTASRSEKFTFSYTGGLYSGRRDARPVLRVLRELVDRGDIDRNDLLIRYAGSDSSLWGTWTQECEVQQYCDTQGLVSQAEAFEIQSKSCINLAMNWTTPGLYGGLSGKLFEYMAVEKPILFLISGGYPDPEVEEVLDSTGTGIVVYVHEMDENCPKFILQNYHAWRESGTTCSKMNDDQAYEYSWNHTVDQLLAGIA